MRMRAIGYVRQSTDKQEANLSGPTQEAKIREYIESIGYDCVGVEHEIQSGIDGLDARPVISKIRQRMAHKEIDALVAYMVSRATRAGGIDALFLANECHEAGAELHFANQGGKVDISTLVGQLNLLLQGDQAKNERTNNLEGMARGRRARSELLGIPIPGQRARYGYELVDVVDPTTGRMRRKAKAQTKEAEAAVVRRVFVMYQSGMVTRTIANQLRAEGIPTATGGEWSRTTVRNILRDTRYIGIGYAYTYKNERLGYKRYKQTIRPVEDRVRLPDGFWPQIIDRDLFYLCQERLNRAAQESTRRNLFPESYLLRGGFVVCGICEYTMVCKSAHNNRNKGGGYLPCYRCNPEPSNAHCPHPTIVAHIPDDYVKRRIRHLAQHRDEVIRQLQEIHQDENSTLVIDLERYRKMYADVQGREKRYIRLLDFAVDEEQEQEIQANLKALADQRTATHAEVRRLERQVEAQQKAYQKVTHIDALLARIAERVDAADYNEWRDTIRAFGVVVTVYPQSGYKRRFKVKIDIPDDWDEDASIVHSCAGSRSQ
jgi:site-specific DNA recombinase